MDKHFITAKPNAHTTYLSYLILLLTPQTVINKASISDCNRKSNESQCGYGELCLDNSCHTAVSCSSDRDCENPEASCVSDYCQPAKCSTKGECVHGQFCSVRGICLYRDNQKVPENTEYELKLPEQPLFGRNNVVMTWVKHTNHISSPIASLSKLGNDATIVYFNEFCKGKHKCSSSSKVEVNTVTGTLTIFDVSFNDEGIYYHTLELDRDIPNKYEIYLEVIAIPNPSDVIIKRIPDDQIKPGMEVEFTCVVPRIKPSAKYISWEFTHDKPRKGQVTTEQNGDGYTSRQRSVIKYRFSMHDYRKSVCCKIKPYYAPVIPKCEIVDLSRPLAVSNDSSTNYRRTLEPAVKVTDPKTHVEVTIPSVIRFIEDDAHSSDISPLRKDLKITGLPDLLEPDMPLSLTCTISKIKPEASDMYWIINGQRINGTINTILNNDDEMSCKQQNSVTYRVEQTPHNLSVECVLVPFSGETIILQKTRQLPYSPTEAYDSTLVISVVAPLICIIIGVVIIAVLFIKHIRKTTATEVKRESSVEVNDTEAHELLMLGSSSPPPSSSNK